MNALETKIKAVIFDMDGLILDTETQTLIAWQTITDQHKYPFDRDFFISLIGLPQPTCYQMMEERLNSTESIEKIWEQMTNERYRMIETSGIPLKRGIRELLKTLESRRIPCSVATSTHREEAQKHLADAGLLNYFAQLTCGDEVSRGKPDPEIFLTATAKTGYAPEECLVFEDSPGGITAASTAGIRTIMIPDIIQPDNKTKDKTFTVLSSLEEAARKIDELLR